MKPLNGAFSDQRTSHAFEIVKRADFLPPEIRQYAPEDEALPIGHGQTNSQPYTVKFMLGLLNLQTGEKVLDVGSGSGWTTTLLAYLVGKGGGVVGVEIVPDLVEFGRTNLSKYNFSWAKIVQAGSGLGYKSDSPYDKILVSASSNEIPEALLDQLKPGGRMVIPVGNSIFSVDKTSFGKIVAHEYPGFVFVPLV